MLAIKSSKILLPILICWFIYAYFSIDFSPEITEASRQFGINSAGVLIGMQVSFTLFYLFIWIFAGKSIVALLNNAHHLKVKNIQTGFVFIAWGMVVLLLQLITSALLSSTTKDLVLENDALQETITIATNYLHVYFPLAGFILILLGVLHLNSERKIAIGEFIMSTITTALVAVVYFFIIFSNETRQIALNELQKPSYYISDMLIITTIFIPTIVGWFCSILAAFVLSNFAHESLSRNSTTKIVNGLFCIIFASITLQGILSLGTARFIAIGITGLLAIIYLFFLFNLLGYFFVLGGSHAMIKNSSLSKNVS